MNSVKRLALCLLVLCLMLAMMPAAAEGETQINPTSLRVCVFNDANNNGVLGTNEDFLPGAVISLITMEGDREVVVASMTTDAQGEAVLLAPAGRYILRCELPEDYGFAKKGSKNLISNSSMDLNAGRIQEATVTLEQNAQTEFGIGAMQTATLAGNVWLDVNSDGLWQDDEPGVSGMRIVATGIRNGLVYETFSDAQGRFEIRQIRNGTYDIQYFVPEGYVFTVRSSGPQEQRSLMTTEAERIGEMQVTFERGDVLDGQNIGLVTESVIEGYCFLDANYNGIFDEGEEVLGGVEIEMFRQSNSVRQRTVFSDDNGYYRIGNVRQDVFRLKVLLPTGYTFTMNVPGNPQANQFEPRDGRREQMLFDVSATNGETTQVMVGAIVYGSISGVVYYDDNFTGSNENGDRDARNVTVILLNARGEAIKSAKTNRSGAFTFNDLTPGTYSISVTPPSGYAFTTTGEGSVVSNDNGLGVSGEIEVALGQDVTDVNAGMIRPSRVTGRVFTDSNDNGLYDAGEKGLQGAVVTLMSEAGEEAVAQIGADDTFSFHPVLPGRYYLRYQLPEDAVYARLTNGGNAISGDGTGEWFVVGAGDEQAAPLCGGLYLGTISGYAFNDSDGSGDQGADESRFAGVKVTLTPEREDVEVYAAETGADGSFLLAGVRPGAYSLTVTCPEGYVLSALSGVTLPVVSGKNDQTVRLDAGMGEEWLDQPLGFVMPSTYAGVAWLDENLNGLCDATERPAAGEHVLLISQRTGKVVADMTTAADGSFRAEGLAPGLYTLAFELTDDVSGTQKGDSTFAAVDGRLVMTDIAIAEGTDAVGAKLGLVRETRLQGLVWLDHDGEIRPVTGAKVTLLADGEALETVTTGKDGLYTFDNLMPGEYVIHTELPEGYLPLEPGDRRIADGKHISILESIGGVSGQSGAITVVMAVDQLHLDIGSVKPGRLGDFCWLDENGNGLQDEGDGGIPGVEIVLMRDGEVIASTVSDQYGFYVFEQLYPGEYTLVVTAPTEVKPTVMRTDMPMIVSVLQENGESIVLPVVSNGAKYDADLGFVLVEKDVYPAGYGDGATQDWTKLH